MMLANCKSIWAKCEHVSLQLAQEGITVSPHTLLRWTKIDLHARIKSKRVLTKKIRTQETINRVRTEIEQRGRDISIRRLAKELHITYSTMWHIVRKDLKLYPHKFQKAQAEKKFDERDRVDLFRIEDAIEPDDANTGSSNAPISALKNATS